MQKSQNLVGRNIFQVFTRHEWVMLISLMLPTGMDLINSGMLAIALPAIQTEYKVGVELLALVTASGFLPRVTLMPIYGRIGDMIGKKNAFLLGLLLFLIGSLICFLSTTFYRLLIGRFIQGVGGGAVPLAVAITLNAVSKEKGNRALSIINSSGPAINVIGPIIGGFIIVWMGWKSIFVIIITISVVALVLGTRYIPNDRNQRNLNDHFDVLGAISLTSTVFFLLLAVMTLNISTLRSEAHLFILSLSVLSLIIFIWNALRKTNPFVELRIVKNRQFTATSLATGLRMFSLSGAGFLLVLFLANIYNMNPKSIGIFLVVFRLALLIGVIYSGTIADRWLSRNVGMVCLTIQGLGLILISQILPLPSMFALALGMFMTGLGAGLCIVAFMKEAAVSLGDQRIGLATGLFNTIRFSGVALSSSILGLFLASIFTQHGGSQSVFVAYQSGFLILAGVAFLGVIASIFIPVLSTNKAH